MTAYFIVWEPSQRENESICTNSNGFIMWFNTYDSAKEYAEQWVNSGDVTDYVVCATCTDERNHVI